uniref:Uncharacterized protein n=1 Tax=Lepeophtheirus salmonis TaxID=72036 RepID=A0A0K2V161_LEPSM
MADETCIDEQLLTLLIERYVYSMKCGNTPKNTYDLIHSIKIKTILK